MDIKFESGNIIADICNEIAKIPEITVQKEKKLMSRIGKIIKKNVIKNMPPDADGNLANYDGSRPYMHMRDDVKVSVKYKNGFSYVVVGGGKLTGYKWHLLDSGTYNKDGTKHTRATHFIDKAMSASESEINNLIDELTSEVANGK